MGMEEHGPATGGGEAEPAPADPPLEDPVEARAEELGDLASMQSDPGEGIVDAEPGPATEKQASTGASSGTGPLGVSTLDEGATAQVTGRAPPAPGDEELPAG